MSIKRMMAGLMAGILMMLCGALCLFLFMAPRPKKEEVAR